MTAKLHKLISRIRKQFPDLDVRTDQCDIVRIIMKGLLIGIQEQDDALKAEFISLESECDFETTVTKTLRSNNLALFEEELLNSLRAIRIERS